MAITILFNGKNGSVVPEYKSPGAAGADICAYLGEPVSLKSFERKLIPTGISVEIPHGYEIQVRPRSGFALKQGITVLNSPGTIDSDYRGEIGVLLINLGSETVTIENGDRIAQLVVAAVERPIFLSSSDLSITGRGSGGYGSTGKK